MANAQRRANQAADMLPAQLHAAAEELALTLLRAGPVAAFYQAKERLEADEEALTILERLATAQVELRGKQVNGPVTHEDIDRLRALNEQARNNQLIVEYVTTQHMANDYLAEVNQEISQLLGIDFSAFASAGCC